jgi:hypothetical protein
MGHPVTVIRRRPRAALVAGIFVYLLAGFTVSDVQSIESPGGDLDCPAPLLLRDGGERTDGDLQSAGPRGITILQGNAWMLPSRPLILPYAFSVDRQQRLERLVHLIRACRRTLASGRTDLTGTVNVSGLVTLTRLPVRGIDFVEFDPLPMKAKAIDLEPSEAGPLLPQAWVVSEHAPTYDPSGNRYTVEGSNNTPENHHQRRLGVGARAVDWLVNPAPGRLRAVSQVLDGVELSDHHFVQHLPLPQGE